MERRQLIVDEWERLDRPVVSVGSRKQVVPHPLVRMLAEADLLCERLRKPLRVRHRGPVSFLERTARTVVPAERRDGEPPRVTLRGEPRRRTRLRSADDPS